MQCCGNTGPGDFGGNLPNTCCNVNALTNGACIVGDNFTRGCLDTLTDLIQYSADLIAAVFLAVAGVEVFIFNCKIVFDENIYLFNFQLIGFIFACCLASSIRSNSRR